MSQTHQQSHQNEGREHVDYPKRQPDPRHFTCNWKDGRWAHRTCQRLLSEVLHVRGIWCWPLQSLFLSLDKVGTQVTMDDEDTRSERKQVTSSGTGNTDHSLPAS